MTIHNHATSASARAPPRERSAGRPDLGAAKMESKHIVIIIISSSSSSLIIIDIVISILLVFTLL